METIRFISYKIASKIDLKKKAAYFRLPEPQSWEDFIVLGENQLSELFRYRMSSKKSYIFEYGCVVFVNFEPIETGDFFKKIRLISSELDYEMLAGYSESHTITVSDDNTTSLWKASKKRIRNTDGLTDIVAVVLAKSAALSREETQAGLLLDEAERFIIKLQKGALNINKRNFSSAIAHMLRFEYESAASIKVFDRPSEVARNLLLREAFDELAEYYELEDRYDVLEKKIAELRKIIRSYSVLRYNRQEKRLLLFEIFLLLLFPAFRILESLLERLGIENVIQLFF